MFFWGSPKELIHMKLIARLSGAALLLTIFACGGGGLVHSPQVRISNLSSLATMDANLTDSSSQAFTLSTALPKFDTTCNGIVDLAGGGDPTLEITLGGSTTNLLTTSVSLPDDEGTSNSILVFGPTTGLKSLVINSGELPSPLQLYICDLGVTDTNVYQVFVKNITTNQTTQTTSVQGVDNSRVVPFLISTAGTYEVDLVNGSTVVATAQFTIDSNNPINIAAFIDNPSGPGLVPHIVHGAEGCVAPAIAHR